MKPQKRCSHCARLFAFILALFVAAPLFSQTATIKGKVMDQTTGDVLPGANVVVKSLDGSKTTGNASDVNGDFSVGGLQPGTYIVSVSYIGYARQELADITLAAGETKTFEIKMEATGISVNAISISASRRPEKTLEAPASISVISSSEIRGEIAPSAATILRNTPGVDMSTTGIDRREIVLRGFSNAFSGATYILTDYRQAAVPSLAVNMHSIMPNLTIDLDKIEVVRGPGSALYGAGVDAGVIHYITKDPFSHPGTTVSFSGGERSFFTGAFRHAGILSDNVAYKLTGIYGQADDWELDPNNPEDAMQLDDDAKGLSRKYDFQKLNINGMLQFRLGDATTLTATGGFSRLDATVLSGIGTVQADNFGYKYGQVRMQSGGLFAQVYLNNNDGGNSFVYGTGDKVVDNSTQINAQAQYDFDVSDKQSLILGLDYDRTAPDTKGTIYGRNEDNDLIAEFGIYGQSLTRLSQKFDLTLALRGDYSNIFEEFRLSPRIAVVFKADHANSFRATYNYAFAAPGNNSLFLDIVAREPDEALPIVIRGRGSLHGYTFPRNPDFAAFAGSDLVARSLNPATLGAAQPVGLPLADVYAAVYAGLNALDAEAIKQALNLPPTIPNIIIDGVKALFAPDKTVVEGFSKGALGLLNTTSNSIDPISDVHDIAPLQPTTSQTWEAGYKGLFQDRLLFAIDAYYTKKKNFVGPVLIETPFVLVPMLAQDLEGALATGIKNNAQLIGALNQLGFDPDTVAAAVVGLASQSLPGPQTPVAIVAPTENDLGEGKAPELLGTYKNFGNVEFWGIDASLRFFATDNLHIFSNVSIVSDDFFDNKELDEAGTDITLALNAPKLKIKGGFSYNAPSGLSFGASGRFIQGFPVRSGPYIGNVKDYFLLDVNAGYDLASVYRGLRFDISVSNLLDDKHREFIGAPEIGRLAMARFTVNF